MASDSTQHIIKSQALLPEKKEEESACLHPYDPAPALCRVQVPPDLKIKLQKLSTDKQWGLLFPADERFEMRRLREEFQRLCQLEEQTKHNNQKLLIKQYKLAILKSYLKFLRNNQHADDEVVEKQTTWHKFWIRMRHGFLLFAGILSDGIGSFLGSEDIVSIIPSISSAGILITSICLSVINAVLFYAFESNAIKEAMGLDTLAGIGLHLAADEEEIELTKEINQEMNNDAINHLSRPDYLTHARFTDTLNKAVVNKKQFRKDAMQEKLPLKILRYLVTGMGALMVGFNGFFMMKALLLSLAPALLATPAGPILIAVGIGIMLTYYFAVRSKSVLGVLNPGMEKFKDVKTKYEKFTPQSELALRKHYDDRNDKSSMQHIRDENADLRKENQALKKTLLQHNIHFRESPPSLSPTGLSSLKQGSPGIWNKPLPANIKNKPADAPQVQAAEKQAEPILKW